MFKYLSKKRFLIFLILSLVLSGVFILPVIYSLSDKLSKTKRVEANILLVEGWLPAYAIEKAYDEFLNNSYNRIITTGLQSPPYFVMPANGYLIFYPQKYNLIEEEDSIHLIEVEASSELEGENSACFNILINDSLIAEFLAEKKGKKYPIKWKGKLSNIDSILIRFTNDGRGDFGDRNLYVKNIIIDQNITIPYHDNSEYDIGLLDGKKRIINNYDSYAELAKLRLLSIGLDPSLINAVPGNRTRINRTLTSALAVREWLKTSETKVEGINIVSLGTHAKRTWMIYNKILDSQYNIGIISISDYRERHSMRYKILKTIRETIGIIYYWIILLPY
jgi:hypothetical protein